MYLPIAQQLVLVILVSAISIFWYRFITADQDKSSTPGLSLLFELLYGLLVILVLLAACFVAAHLLLEKPLALPGIARSIWGYALLMVVCGPIWQWRRKARSLKQSEHPAVTQFPTFTAAQQHFSQVYSGRPDARREDIEFEDDNNRKRISMQLFGHPHATWDQIVSDEVQESWTNRI